MPGAAVSDLQRGLCVLLKYLHCYSSSRRSVANCVVHQVSEQYLQHRGVAVGYAGTARLEAQIDVSSDGGLREFCREC